MKIGKERTAGIIKRSANERYALTDRQTISIVLTAAITSNQSNLRKTHEPHLRNITFSSYFIMKSACDSFR